MQRRAFEVSPYRTAVSVALVLVGMLILAVTPAVAGIGGSDVPTWPVSATVGDIINVSITIVNGSTTPNNTENVVVENFSVNPSCKSSANAICLGGNVDPGIFHTLVGGQGTGAAGTACPGTVFDISPPFPDGGLVLTPQGTVTLGSTASGVNLTCTVNFSLRVFKMPANPTTNALTGVQLHGANSGLQGLGTGSAQITIAKATPTLETTSSPNAGNVVPGTAVSDTVTLTKAPGAILPTGSVRFILCQPGDVNVTGCPSPKGQKIGDDKLLGVAPISATSDSTTDTLAIGTYCWRARYLGDANYNAVNHTDAVAECFTTAKQPVTVTTLSNPTGGNVTPGSVVTDTVTVTGGGGQPTPTGTVTWFLCQPGEVTGQGCVSPAGTQIGPVKTLNPFGIRVSGGTANTLTVGQYCWRVEYSGDAVYQPNSHTDAGNECFTTVKQQPNIVTLSHPTGANVAPGTAVTDSVTVTGGPGQPTPTGTVTWFLCQPGEVTANGGDCSANGTQIGPIKPLNINGIRVSGGTTNTATAGKYCWRVAYAGDAFYLPLSHTDAGSECFTVVLPPQLTLVKSPDNGTYAPGDTVSFTIVVTNGGQGTAHNVHFNPLDLLPDPNSTLDWGPASPTVTCNAAHSGAATCTVSGASGSQVLDCNFGDLATTGSCSVTVSTATSPTDVNDCIASPGLVNAATAVDDEGDVATDDANQSCVTGCPTSNPLLGVGTKCTVIESDAFKVSITGPAGQFQGDVCIGDGGSLDMSGDNFILGDVHFETTVACNGCTTGATGRVRGADGQSGVVDINATLVGDAIDACDNAAVDNAAKACTIGDYTQSLSALASATADPDVRRLTGAAGENVVCVSEVDVSKTIELFGGATTSFVINVVDGGAFKINGGKIVAVAPVTPSKVLYNVLGSTGGQVAFTGGGGGVGCCKASIDGTLIAIERDIALAPGLINGQLCSNQKMDLVSGSAVRCPAP